MSRPLGWLQSYGGNCSEENDVRIIDVTFVTHLTFLTLCDRFNRAFHVEVLFGNFIMFAFQDFFKTTDRIGDRNVFPFRASKHFSDVERLTKEALNLTSAHNRELVLWTQFVHPEDGDDVLQVAVTLQHSLHTSSNVVMIFADNFWGERFRGRGQRVDRWINA